MRIARRGLQIYRGGYGREDSQEQVFLLDMSVPMRPMSSGVSDSFGELA